MVPKNQLPFYQVPIYLEKRDMMNQKANRPLPIPLSKRVLTGMLLLILISLATLALAQQNIVIQTVPLTQS